MTVLLPAVDISCSIVLFSTKCGEPLSRNVWYLVMKPTAMAHLR